MSEELQSLFQAATIRAKQLSKSPDNDTLLQLYALYKQATAGDVSGKRPGMFDMVGRAKFDAWTKIKGLATDDAMRGYIELVDSLE
ncbi:MAG: acyl-CoA-binding protein [Caldilineaceae bacterium]|nr:acyl-CoA-binding protein [Caldilineaceae bacterium]